MARVPNLEELKQIGRKAGLDDVAVTGVEPILEARQAIEERKASGLHAGMTFTFGNPQRATDPSLMFEGAQSVIVALRRYKPPTWDAPETPDHRYVSPKGIVAAYVRSDEYGSLRKGLEAIAEYLNAFGARTEIVMDDNRLADRAVAARAGLGWLGRNTMLLHPEFGSWTTIGSVVTDLLIEAESDRLDDGCGSCRRCSDDCPTGALNTFGVLDANKCLAWLLQAKGIFPREYRSVLGDRLYGCDDCQLLCPINDDGLNTRDVPLTREPKVDILALLDSSDEELMENFGHWYIPRRQPAYLRRNALVVLGNTGSSDDPEIDRILSACLTSDDALVRSHAVWAAMRLKKRYLVTRQTTASLLQDDPDGMVKAELDEWGITMDTNA
ncbi:MAG: tRNA epoxyqueuosine(34) reductase QueG [Actinomycetota bacterium]|nr:tRNA epoxyqueuosine(34) reductase QueG [Actinomycetota bacterium]MEC9057970.1 tRNA epoxyqueuosine(34) reductase QueG [Actinomycetota bacterium]MED5361923.1 tRNA epoxyqueuosine(34) reductase QueG [Actinomycetota bacterium]